MFHGSQFLKRCRKYPHMYWIFLLQFVFQEQWMIMTVKLLACVQHKID